MDYFSALLISIITTIALMPFLVRVALKYQMIDVPDARKVHASPIPRCGGVALSIGACVPLIIGRYDAAFIVSYLAGVGILLVLGIFDDISGIDYRFKFLGQLLAAGIVVLFGKIRILSIGILLPNPFILPYWASVLLSIVVIVGVTNAINLSDGLDGLAGGLCLMSFCCIAYLSYFSGKTTIVLMAISMSGAIFGFLRYNTYPASLFMGDTGSMFLGFSLVCLSLAVTQGSTPFSPFLALVIVGFPVMDTIVVMIERIIHGKSPFVADRNHFHHKLLKMGFLHNESVLLIYMMQGILITIAVVFRFAEDEILLAYYLLLFVLVMGAFFCVERMNWRIVRPNFLDSLLQGRIKMLKEQGIFIKIIFWLLERGLPLLLILSTLVPVTIPRNLLILSAVLLLILLATRIFWKQWLIGTLSFAIYLFIPFVIFAGSEAYASWIENSHLNTFYHLGYLGLIFCVIGTLKLTHRKMGFKLTPMDFLILFIVFIFLFISGSYHQETFLAGFATKTLTLFFSYEVLIGELRGQYQHLAAETGVAMALVIVRGFIG